MSDPDQESARGAAKARAEARSGEARAALERRRGLLFILSSPSGAGKSTLSRRLLASDDAFVFSVSATTRAPRPGEVNGRDYHFLSREEFLRMVEAGQMLEHAEVFGNLYGTPRAPVEAALEAGRDVLFDVDWQGGQQLRNSPLKDAVVSVFILPPSIAELERRLRARGQDSPEVIAGRMAKARDEISHWAEYDYVLVNDDLDRCEAEIRAILAAERLRRERRPGLVGFVQALNREFEERIA
ncbi:guanylate kinase [Oceanicella actignis]|uniref:Guanylate kinase n=1 Tax=Oceanicella actignis TaxID=1189325 RepID=A0A1M7RTP6_9RHOB|nr:guanylate kinase [Oceanicella actignis]SET04394.1 guanylate kinase [Oceanicella actignis]SHN49601.1 guanylate kinase [Oceanicella actignis]